MSKHRGKHSNDDKCFSKKWQPILAEAAHDLSFLLGKGYGLKSSLALVGNHYKLNARQQRTLSLICCPSNKINPRKNKALKPIDITNKSVVIDGFNLLITIEALLSGGYIFIAQDGCYRDIASIHGSYKKVVETLPAITLIDTAFKRLNIAHAHWYFDQPVSNAGMLKTLLYQYAVDNQSNWDVDLVLNPDKTLIELAQTESVIVISSDSVIIDNSLNYFNLTEYIIQTLCNKTDNTLTNVIKLNYF